jgi:hypothetical protein
LNDSGSPFGPGDATFATEWDFTLSPDSSLDYDTTKDISKTPEPGTWILNTLVLLGLAIRRTKFPGGCP